MHRHLSVQADIARSNFAGSSVLVSAESATAGRDRLVPRTAGPGVTAAKNSDGLHQQFLKVGSVSGPAGQEFEKLPFKEISRPTTGDQPIAVVAGSNLHRQLRPKFGRPPHLG